MVFGKKKKVEDAAKDEESGDEEDLTQVMFQGPMFNREADLKKHARLVQAALVPVKNMVTDALSRRAHTITMEPAGNRLGFRFVVDGVAYPAGAVPAKQGIAMIQMLKLLAGLDTAERKKPQQGGLNAEFEDERMYLLIDSAPARGGGERLRIKVENAKKQLLKPADINMPEELRKKIRELTAERQGVILVCGPPDSGVTTLSLATLHTVDQYLYAVFSLADVGHKTLTNVTDFQPEEGHDLEMSFDRMERREADVIFMDPLTDPQEAQAIFDFADRLSFIMEFPAASPIDALKKLIDWVGVDHVLRNLHGIMTQKLIRKLCDDCKQAFRPHPNLLKKLRLPPEVSVLYRAPAPPDPDDPNAETVEELCKDCDGVPYHGRAAVFELLEMTDGMKEVIAEGFSPDAIRRQMVADDMFTLQKDALRLVTEGVTSIEEVQRAFSAGKKGAKKRRPVKKSRPSS